MRRAEAQTSTDVTIAGVAAGSLPAHVADVAAGSLPAHVADLTADPGAWAKR